ncbi:MAG: DUF1997 domain-containing protein [Chlorobiales bacterium]|jgi:hypothetical protein|nr:DUF1997 domain-containing protein [Chlorobiales bacterium]
MKVEGTCQGKVVLQSNLDTTFEYLSDHQKILMFNPLCKRVTPTELEKVYQWDFEVSDPKGHPMRLIFFVEQTEEQVVALPDEHKHADVSKIPIEIIEKHRVGNQIKWTEYPVRIVDKMPDERTFLGRAQGLMDLRKLDAVQTEVTVTIKVYIDFDLPKLFKIFPEQVFKVMAETAVAISMQSVSKKMLENISRDFHCSFIGNPNLGAARMG